MQQCYWFNPTSLGSWDGEARTRMYNALRALGVHGVRHIFCSDPSQMPLNMVKWLQPDTRPDRGRDQSMINYKMKEVCPTAVVLFPASSPSPQMNYTSVRKSGISRYEASPLANKYLSQWGTDSKVSQKTKRRTANFMPVHTRIHTSLPSLIAVGFWICFFVASKPMGIRPSRILSTFCCQLLALLMG